MLFNQVSFQNNVFEHSSCFAFELKLVAFYTCQINEMYFISYQAVDETVNSPYDS